jgi:hypothetical protein
MKYARLVLNEIAATLSAKRQTATMSTRRTPTLSINRPTIGNDSADSNAQSAIPVLSEARLYPNSCSRDPMNTPNANTLTGPLPTTSARAPPKGMDQLRSGLLASLTEWLAMVSPFSRNHKRKRRTDPLDVLGIDDRVAQPAEQPTGARVAERRCHDIAVA